MQGNVMAVFNRRNAATITSLVTVSFFLRLCTRRVLPSTAGNKEVPNYENRGNRHWLTAAEQLGGCELGCSLQIEFENGGRNIEAGDGQVPEVRACFGGAHWQHPQQATFTTY